VYAGNSDLNGVAASQGSADLLSFEITKSRANSATALIYYSEVITFKKLFTIFNFSIISSTHSPWGRER
jgi:hypothetical protein